MKVVSHSEGKTIYLDLAKYAAICLSAALFTAACARISIRLPFTPIPITLQVVAVISAGFILGSRMGAASQMLYVAMGAAGLPVFAEGKSTAALLGPTSGYILSFILGAYLAGFFKEKFTANLTLGMALGAIAAVIAIHSIGVSIFSVWLSAGSKMDFFTAISNAWALGSLPFILIDLLKAAAAALLADGTRRVFRSILS